MEGQLAGMSYFSGTDFSKFDLDAPLPDIAEQVNGHQSTTGLRQDAKGKTLREASRSGHRR